LTAGESTPAGGDLRDSASRVGQTLVPPDVEGFKAGHTALRPLQTTELGDVAGKTLLHLHCRCGLETLSWARLGAEVTGVDSSPETIAAARRLAAETGLRATFIESDLSEVEHKLHGAFDIVFASWGALERRRDLDRWAQSVAQYLKPGGTFYLTNVHPFAQMLEETADHDVRVDYPYLSGPEPPLPSRRGCPHSFAEILNAPIDAGLRIEFLHEFPFSATPLWEWMERGQDGWFRLPGRSDDIPFAYSLKATSPAGGA
jgi:SAM-dependent methyltransferase